MAYAFILQLDKQVLASVSCRYVHEVKSLFKSAAVLSDSYRCELFVFVFSFLTLRLKKFKLYDQTALDLCSALFLFFFFFFFRLSCFLIASFSPFGCFFVNQRTIFIEVLIFLSIER